MKPDSAYSIRRQCGLAGVTRSGFYYKPVPETSENLLLMRLIDEQYMRHPEFGYPKAYSDGYALYRGLDAYFRYYNCERKHSALDKQTPAEVFMKGTVKKEVYKEL